MLIPDLVQLSRSILQTIRTVPMPTQHSSLGCPKSLHILHLRFPVAVVSCALALFDFNDCHVRILNPELQLVCASHFTIVHFDSYMYAQVAPAPVPVPVPPLNRWVTDVASPHETSLEPVSSYISSRTNLGCIVWYISESVLRIITSARRTVLSMFACSTMYSYVAFPCTIAASRVGDAGKKNCRPRGSCLLHCTIAPSSCTVRLYPEMLTTRHQCLECK